MSRGKRIFVGVGQSMVALNFLLVLVGSFFLVTGEFLVGTLIVLGNLASAFSLKSSIAQFKSVHQTSDAVRI